MLNTPRRLDANNRVAIAAIVLVAVVVLVALDVIQITPDMQSLLTTVVGGAILFALREYSRETKEQVEATNVKVEENTQLTADAKAAVTSTKSELSELKQVVQDNTRLRLEVEMYRRVFNRIRELPECQSCAGVVAKEFEFARRESSS